jgi:hypothetical protein
MNGTLKGSHCHSAGCGTGAGLLDLAADPFFERSLFVGNNRFEDGPRRARNAE